jgi:hypothetical protein
VISYSFEPDYTTKGRHYAHSLVSWGSVAAGAIAAVAIGALLNIVGLAIGAGAYNLFAIARHQGAISIGGGLFVIFAQFVAFEIGGYIASRSAAWPDHFGGALTGFMVWALAVVFAITLASLVSSGGAVGAAAEASRTARDIHAGAIRGAEIGPGEATGDVVATLAWWGVGALGLGFCGAISGGWIGAHHPDWKDRPRREETVTAFVPR